MNTLMERVEPVKQPLVTHPDTPMNAGILKNALRFLSPCPRPGQAPQALLGYALAIERGQEVVWMLHQQGNDRRLRCHVIGWDYQERAWCVFSKNEGDPDLRFYSCPLLLLDLATPSSRHCEGWRRTVHLLHQGRHWNSSPPLKDFVYLRQVGIDFTNFLEHLRFTGIGVEPYLGGIA